MDETAETVGVDDAGSRGILRVPEVIMAVARSRHGISFVELREVLGLPKSSLHRLLRTLEQEHYLIRKAGLYLLGSESVRLARLISRASPGEDFPTSVRPVMEWAARESGESIILAILADKMTEVVYIDVINSTAPLRISVPVGNRRPLYSSASGKAILAFLPIEFQQRYITETSFEAITPFTTGRGEIEALLDTLRRDAVVCDYNGNFVGMSSLASPAFDAAGNIFCSISVSGPTERVREDFVRLGSIASEAGERMSRILGYADDYPPNRTA